MNETSNIVALRQLDDIDDPLTIFCELVRGSFWRRPWRSKSRRFLPRLTTGAPVSYGMVTARPEGLLPASDRSRSRGRRFGTAERPSRRADPLQSAILRFWTGRTRSLDALLPVPYLRGISTGDFQEALTALLGKDAPNLSPSVISRLTAEWQGEYERRQTTPPDRLVTQNSA
ncbi:hypothetical protein GGE24_007640 [Bradyrhizobium centrosematis]|nr:hypothetical protein [Bradyrhizobium centrosematis]MCS3778263.1 hypothetical protein [Bradyrhizobium centrosematis]